ncbi:MAG: FAD:protein FMN transferase, partial [Clostridia bacterium]|nr:FAD:protein FMN transferase [Clostridia bacterium]
GGDTHALNASDTGILEASPYLVELLAISEEMTQITEGSFDVRTGALLSLWKNCETEQRLPTSEELEAAIALIAATVSNEETGISKSVPRTELDFGAIGKGYTADKVTQMLRDSGVTCGMISFVSTVTVFGEREQGAFRIAIRRPDTSGAIAGYIPLQDESLSVSGDYERFYEINGEKYPHILDPKTGLPAESGIHSAAVVAPKGAVADALSTAIMVMGVEKTAALYNSRALDFEAVIFLDDTILVTDGMIDRFELADEGYQILPLSQYTQ